MKKQLIFNRPDLCYLTIYSWGPGFYKDALVAIIAQLFGVKRIYHFHNKGLAEYSINFFEHLLYKLIFHKADIIIISDRLSNDFTKYVPETRIHICSNGIPETTSERTQDSGLKAQGNVSMTCNLLFFSNLIESKGTFILLEACKILNEKNLNYHCTFAGNEGDVTAEQFIMKLSAEGLENRVTYSGSMTGNEKEEVFSGADIFVHPTYFDCLPLVILEAMQKSLPVVSTFEGAIPEAVEDGVTGFLVPVKDPVSLAEKLEILINDPALRKKMGEEGRTRYEQKFRLEIFEKRLAEILSISENA